jgi:hypothetical protein
VINENELESRYYGYTEWQCHCFKAGIDAGYQTISDSNNICNLPAGCARTSIMRTDKVQPVRDFVREAINALRLGDLTAAQQRLTEANLSLSSIS